MRVLRNLLPPMSVLFPCIFLAWWFSRETQILPEKVNVFLEDSKILDSDRIDSQIDAFVIGLNEEAIFRLSEKPLFSPTRKKFIPEVEVEKPIPERQKVEEEPALPTKVEPPSFQFLGVVSTNSGLSALIRAQDKEKWMLIEDKIGPWTILSVTHDSVIIVHKKQTITVHIER